MYSQFSQIYSRGPPAAAYDAILHLTDIRIQSCTRKGRFWNLEKPFFGWISWSGRVRKEHNTATDFLEIHQSANLDNLWNTSTTKKGLSHIPLKVSWQRRIPRYFETFIHPYLGTSEAWERFPAELRVFDCCLLLIWSRSVLLLQTPSKELLMGRKVTFVDVFIDVHAHSGPIVQFFLSPHVWAGTK